MSKTIEELSQQGKFRAFKDFIKFAEDMDHDASHTVNEFVETSNANNWLYNKEGKFME